MTLDGAPGIKVIKIDTDDEDPRTPLVTLTNNGRHTIAGEDTDVGLLKGGTMLHADIAGTTRKVSDHIVGTSATPLPEADHLDGLSGSTLPDPSVDGVHERTFTQQAHGLQTEFTLSIPKAQYRYYKTRPRIGDYGAYVSDDFDDESIAGLADTIEQFGDRNDLSTRETVDHAIAWVQGMEYTQDKPATGYNEYPKYPFETLVDRGGDCEDTAILLAAVLQAMGYGVVLLLLPDANHMAVGVAGEDDISGSYYEHEGQRYYYVETTGSGWTVGEVPQNVKEQGANAEIEEVDTSPSLALEWESYVMPAQGINFDVTVSNWGDAPATNAAVQVDIEQQGKGVVAQDRTSLPTIPEQKGIKKTLNVKPPAEAPLRVRVGALLDGTLNDLYEGEFRSP
ncbi:transglutaminase-like domain-containing protein [Halosimplex marinum]|uniref:transglutaminase-like domain-containing protein n=1 Tax=Halosimplex marinum TaxID=3396620 RepID=UPI003F56F3F3